MTGAVARADFPPGGPSASAARRFVTATLEDWGRDDIADVAILLVGELVANVVLHAGTAFDVIIHRVDDRVRIEVCDSDFQIPARKHYSSTSTTGRGLMLVEDLAASWGVQPTSDGKSVWFELDHTEPTAAAYPIFDLAEFDVEDFDADVPPAPSGVHPDEAAEDASTHRSVRLRSRRRDLVAAR